MSGRADVQNTTANALGAPKTVAASLVLSILCALTVAVGPVWAAPPSPPVKLIQATTEIPEDQLVDVGVRVFDPGVPPAGEDPEAEDKLEEKGIYRDVRRAEARFFPVHLTNSLQTSGQWGAVRVVPAPTDAVDLVVSGRILESNGRELALEVRAVDTSGKVWLDKKYKQKADPRGYEVPEEGVEPVDPFGSVYNEIANDLLAARKELSEDEIRELRWLSQLHFAVDLAPQAFRDYVARNRRGRTEVARLPAEGDPMLERVIRIRERDYLLVDTFHDQYLTFYDEMTHSYVEWRSYSYEEEVALAKLRKQARMQKILGAMAILGGIVVESDSTVEDVARQGAILGGQIAIQSGIAKGQEAKIHRAAIQELAGSFDAEVAPMVLRVEGQTLRLSGTAENQYSEWRDLLREIWQGEVGLPVDPDDPDQLLEVETPEG
jgi:hypothetical protein